MYYNGNDISEGIVLTKSSRSKEFMVWHYWFIIHGFKYQDSVCNGYHDLVMKWVISDIAITTEKCADYRCIIHGISKSDVKLIY